MKMTNFRNATSDQIKIYKDTWKPSGHAVIVDQTLDIKGKDWCRHSLERWVWSMDAFTSPNKHTFLFKDQQNAKDFASAVH